MPDQSNPADPHFKRESQKYENPIPSREFIMEMMAELGRPLYRDQIAEQLGLESDEQLEALRRRLRAMERDGQILFNRRGGFALVSKMDMVRGRIQGHADGFGFLIPDEGGDDLFVPAQEMRMCLHGDKVVARVAGYDRRGRREASIVQILEHVNQHVVGRYYSKGGVGFVTPDNRRISQDILVPMEYSYGAEDGQFVSVEIVEYPKRKHQAVGRVIQIMGAHMAPGMEIDIAIQAHDIPHDWPPMVEAESEGLSMVLPQEEVEEREDIRDLPLVTIDGEDSMDFDDAVYAERSGRGWRLVVAIADVSHYVQPGTGLDTEARLRGNSVYFPGRVIPMLPEILSNGLCSINPEVDRFCMVCDMQISASGKLGKTRFYSAVMRSHARLTYTKVAGMLVDEDEGLCNEYAEVLPHLQTLYQLYQKLHDNRVKRGAIDFDTTETRVVFSEGKKIEAIVPTVRNDAHRLIEECMLMANVATAEFLTKNEIPALYRVHDGPKPQKLENLREFLKELGLTLPGGDTPEAKDYGKLLESIQGRPDAHLIQTVMLRSLSQAVYSPVNQGHFGLAFEAYAHFTSPIRRYPDLLVHRAIRHVLSGHSGESFRYGMEEMVILGEHCSMTERRADEATRDSMDWLKCEYMLDKVGEEFDGVISSVTGFGLFVELSDIFVEGLVHITNLQNDYYHFDAAKHRLQGEHSNKSYRLADEVRIRVVRVELDEKKIDFELVEEQADMPAKKPAKKRSSRRRRRRR